MGRGSLRASRLEYLPLRLLRLRGLLLFLRFFRCGFVSLLGRGFCAFRGFGLNLGGLGFLSRLGFSFRFYRSNGSGRRGRGSGSSSLPFLPWFDWAWFDWAWFSWHCCRGGFGGGFGGASAARGWRWGRRRRSERL